MAAALVLVVVVAAAIHGGEGAWCVVRSEASNQALQTAIDYACGSGADCVPIQPSGLCYLPNTIQAHASYAFNSYYQRKSNAPGSCDFSGSATLAKTDPSYGSCVFPANPSTAGATTSGGGTTPTIPGFGAAPPPPPTLLAPLMGLTTPPPLGPDDDTNSASAPSSSSITILVVMVFHCLS
ncbi:PLASMODESMATA CALLOSE-BINDING PROTEIN 3-like [Impatiens glandulifera]|uniref:PLASMODESMATA CALLOSE-BINDING PROTEIN 3-like n=1 Tax=Impatiens glandulifera TaxID=253017 RepID=UPI001FB0BFE4|nr:PLASMODESMATA CALLOSE-BINDING PROTEIN 3-like [Impatiens glandulifera]